MALRQRDDEVEVLPRLAGGRQRRPVHLDLPVGVGGRPALLGLRGGGEDHVRLPGRLGEEDVLHDEMVELCERCAGVRLVGVGHRGVLAHDVHPADLALVDRVHDLDHREA